MVSDWAWCIVIIEGIQRTATVPEQMAASIQWALLPLLPLEDWLKGPSTHHLAGAFLWVHNLFTCYCPYCLPYYICRGHMVRGKNEVVHLLLIGSAPVVHHKSHHHFHKSSTDTIKKASSANWYHTITRYQTVTFMWKLLANADLFNCSHLHCANTCPETISNSVLHFWLKQP